MDQLRPLAEKMIDRFKAGGNCSLLHGEFEF